MAGDIVHGDEIDELREREHFRAVANAFKIYYKFCSIDRIQKSENIISQLSSNHQSLLDKYKNYLTKFKTCVEINTSVVNLIIKDVGTMFENFDHSVDVASNVEDSFPCNYNNCGMQLGNDLVAASRTQHDAEKVQSVLKNIVRDWSEAGAAERRQCYKPILDELDSRFPRENFSNRSDVKVLVPGAGLGRLAWEIAARGFSCQGNEFSLFMLFASHFILNRCPEVHQHTIYPWVHQYVNHLTSEHQIQAVTFPDVSPKTWHPEFSIAAGDFLKVYRKEEWNVVATCFFIDCAPNVIHFIERIYMILRPGGLWINLGPLLYHYSDMPNEISIEPPYDMLMDIIKSVGFTVLKEQTGVKTKYAQNPNSMMQHEYNSVFFVCQRPTTWRFVIMDLPLDCLIEGKRILPCD